MALEAEQGSPGEDILEDRSAAIVFGRLPLQVHISLGHGVDSEGIRWPGSR